MVTPFPVPSPPRKRPPTGVSIVISNKTLDRYREEFFLITGLRSVQGSDEQIRARISRAFVREFSGQRTMRFSKSNYPTWLIEMWAYLYFEMDGVDADEWKRRLIACGFPYGEDPIWPDLKYYWSLDHRDRNLKTKQSGKPSDTL